MACGVTAHVLFVFSMTLSASRTAKGWLIARPRLRPPSGNVDHPLPTRGVGGLDDGMSDAPVIHADMTASGFSGCRPLRDLARSGRPRFYDLQWNDSRDG